MSANVDMTSRCAACGKGGDGLKPCNACKMVKYCSVGCEEDHRPKHEEECRKRAAELFDEELFKDHPPAEDCPICFLPLPIDISQARYLSCCGKTVCDGCMTAVERERGGTLPPCFFCRREPPRGDYKDKEVIGRLRKRLEANDHDAFANLGCYYHRGQRGLAQDSNKAIELWSKGAELGSFICCGLLSDAYRLGWGVEKSTKKATHYFQLAAMGGCLYSRFSLGVMEEDAGNMDRALKHYMIAARAGCDKSLKEVKHGYAKGYISKDDLNMALHAHQKSVDETKSENRDKAAQG